MSNQPITTNPRSDEVVSHDPISSARVYNNLTPLEPPYSEEITSVLASYPSQDGYVLGLFRTFANSLRFLTKGVPNHLDKASPLPLRVREIVILRVTANKECEYEWGVHVSIFAHAAKLTPEQIADTCKREQNADIWTSLERDLIAAIDQLCALGKMDAQTLAGFRAAFNLEQQLEIFALCGTYQTISFVANHADLPLEGFGSRFPV
jgi:alkylhydroperoxidase family enzyme